MKTSGQRIKPVWRFKYSLRAEISSATFQSWTRFGALISKPWGEKCWEILDYSLALWVGKSLYNAQWKGETPARCFISVTLGTRTCTRWSGPGGQSQPQNCPFQGWLNPTRAAHCTKSICQEKTTNHHCLCISSVSRKISSLTAEKPQDPPLKLPPAWTVWSKKQRTELNFHQC